MIKKRTIRTIVHWSFTIFTVFYIITGFGISHYQIITPMTFGILSKATSFQLHSSLIYLFILLFLLHILVTTYNKMKRLVKKL